MLKFFALCSGSSKHQLKPGQVGIHAYQVKTVKKRDMISFAQPQLQNGLPSKSFKNEVQNDETIIPIQTFKQDPSKLTESTGDQQTFLRTVHKSNFEELSENLQAKKQKFTDPDFPPANVSLGKDPLFEKNTKKWVRLGQLYKNPVFFSNDVEPNDVLQGYVAGSGNCYLLSAIANLAKNPNRIKQIFGNKEVSNEGIYYVKLFNKGAFKEIIIDDFIPVSNFNSPLFARPPPETGEIWVLVLEKSFAKLFGSFKSMNGMFLFNSGGLPSEAYYALTGAPTFYYDLVNSKNLSQKYWNVIETAFLKNYCVDFGTSKQVNQLKSLRPNHAYTMVIFVITQLGAYNVQGYKLVKLRNPMGAFEWVGRASDYDAQFWKKITPQNKQLIGYVPGRYGDGIFFMLWEDVATYFILFEVCEYKDNANVLSIRKPFTIKNANMFEIQTSGGQTVVSLIEDSQRGTQVDISTFKYSRSYMIIAKVLKNQNDEISYKPIRIASRNQFAAHHQKVNLESGTYLVYAKYRWNDSVDKNASFVVYSDSAVRIREVKQTQHPEFLQKSYLSIISPDPEFTQPKEKYSYIKQFYGQSGGFGYYAVKAQKDIKETIEIEIDDELMKKSRLTLKKPYKNKGKSIVILKAGQNIIIPFRNKDVVILQNLEIPDIKISVKQ